MKVFILKKSGRQAENNHKDHFPTTFYKLDIGWILYRHYTIYSTVILSGKFNNTYFMNLKSKFLKKTFNYQQSQSDKVKIIQFYVTLSLKLLTTLTQWLVSLKGEDVFFVPLISLQWHCHKLAPLVSTHILTTLILHNIPHPTALPELTVDFFFATFLTAYPRDLRCFLFPAVWGKKGTGAGIT